MADKLGRREFITGIGLAAAALPLYAEAQQPSPAATQPAGAADVPPAAGERDGRDAYLFFTPPEAAFIAAVVDRLIPPDDTGPGASEAGVVWSIDRQLSGSFGRGYRLYLAGPWSADGLPSQGYQLALTPAEIYRIAIVEIDKAVRQGNGGKAFAELNGDQQDAVLQSLDKGELQLETVPGKLFFDLLRANAIEGYFADPAYGGNREAAAWKMIGFPGAHGDYADAIVQYRNKPYGQLPVKLADLQ